MVEHNGHGVREDFSEQPACQMPEVTRPHFLYAVALCELRKNGVYTVAKSTQNALLLGCGSPFLEEYGARSSTNAR